MKRRYASILKAAVIAQKLRILLLLLLVIQTHLFITAESAKPVNRDNVMILKMQDNGKEVNIRIEDLIQIELEGIGSTGYWWYFDKLDKDYFELISSDTRSGGAGKKEISGNPVTGIWLLRVKKPGRSVMKMKYYRIWETSEKAISQFEIGINIKSF